MQFLQKKYAGIRSYILFYLYLWLYTNKSVRSPINPMTSIASPDTEICL